MVTVVLVRHLKKNINKIFKKNGGGGGGVKWGGCTMGGDTLISFFSLIPLILKRTVGASTTFMGNEFQSLMFFGRKEEPLYWVLVVSRVSCLSWVHR